MAAVAKEAAAFEAVAAAYAPAEMLAAFRRHEAATDDLLAAQAAERAAVDAARAAEFPAAETAHRGESGNLMTSESAADRLIAMTGAIMDAAQNLEARLHDRISVILYATKAEGWAAKKTGGKILAIVADEKAAWEALGNALEEVSRYAADRPLPRAGYYQVGGCR